VQYEPSTDTDAPARAQAYLAELVRVTNDHKFRLPGWQKKVIAIVQSKAGLAEFSYLMDRLQKDVNPRMAAARGNDVIEDPKRFAAAELSRIHNELGGA